MNQESGKNPLKKLDMEQFIEDHSRDMMDGQEKMTAGQWLAVSLAWTLLGVLLANLEIKMIPWIGLLGWVLMVVGCINLVGVMLLLKQKKAGNKIFDHLTMTILALLYKPNLKRHFLQHHTEPLLIYTPTTTSC